MTRSPRTVRVLATAVLAVVAFGVVSTRASAAPSGVDASLAEFRMASSSLLAIDRDVRTNRADLVAAYVEIDRARERIVDADARIESERASLAAVGIVAYVQMGVDPNRSTREATRILTARTGRMRSLMEAADAARAELDRAERHRDRAAGALTAVIARRAGRLVAVRASGARLESDLADLGAARLSAVTYTVALDVADRLAAELPRCHLPAAVLAGLAQITGAARSERIDDAGQPVVEVTTDATVVEPLPSDELARGPLLLPARSWERFGGDLEGDGTASVEALGDAALALGRTICADGADLRSNSSLRAAVLRATSDVGRTNAVLGAARRLARTSRLGLGSMPWDPSDSLHQQIVYAPSAAAVGSTIADLLSWSRARLGTPYSQCLGDERPDDPPCPEGTNRYGAGFFDCSGFVSAAYASIGLRVPATTSGMESDPEFMATTVATTIDEGMLRPGDVILLDGHVALWSGTGRVIHANGVKLVEEPMPTWFRNGVVAVLRPLPSR